MALLGIATILFQAILFGWHHHEVAFARWGGSAASLHNATEPLAPAAAEDLCEICIALHHQSAAPLAFIGPPVSSAMAASIEPPGLILLGRAGPRGFHARAPPRA